jgi:3-methyladenine DNA glycosylase/8-oxoguanine DNA glycosylase
MATRNLDLERPLDLVRTVGPLAHGTGDPTIRVAAGQVVRASRTPEGPASIDIRLAGPRVSAEAWGPGAAWLLERLPAFLGEDDDRASFRAEHPLLADLDRRLAGVRIGRSEAVFEALVPAILEQKVLGSAARRAYRGIVARWGEPAPGPHGLRLQPEPAALARLPYYALHPLGVERRRADTLRRAAASAARLEEAVRMTREAADARLRALPGIGGWTAAEVTLRALGDADAVSVGDFHLPHLVAWALAGEPRATDARMLELLEPWRGHRGRVVRLLEASGIWPPAYGPRMARYDIAGI